jgi:AraC-like DNA-binding protein
MPYYNHEVSHAPVPHSVYVQRYSNKNHIEMIYCNWHKEQELLLVESGMLELHVDDKILTLKEGEIGCVNTGRMHYGNSVSKVPCTVLSFIIDLNHVLALSGETDSEHMKGLASGKLNFPSYLSTQYQFYEQIKKDLIEINEIYEQRPASYELKMKSLLFDMFYYFDGSVDFYSNEREWDKAKSKERRDRIFAVFDFLEKNYMHQITVGDMADHIYTGRDTFYKFFVSITGISPLVYLINLRLQKAEIFLMETDMSVTDICFQTGFSNVSYFIRLFSKHYGITPKKYRMSLGNL